MAVVGVDGEELSKRCTVLDGGDLVARGHNLPYLVVAEVEHVLEHVDFARLEGALRLADVEQGAQLGLGDRFARRIIGTQRGARTSRHPLQNHHERPQQELYGLERAGVQERHALGVVDGEGLGHDLAEHQERERAGYGGHDDTGILAEQVDGYDRHDGGEGDVYEVVAEQDRGEQPFGLFQHTRDTACARHVAVDQVGDAHSLQR